MTLFTRRSGRALRGALAAAGVVAALAARPGVAAHPVYPVSPVRPVSDTLNGRVVVDPYRWLEDDSSDEVRQWTAAENALTRATLDAFPGRAALTARLSRLLALPTSNRPMVRGSRLFYSRREGAENQPIVYVRERDRAPRVALDPNRLSGDGTVALDWLYPSPDGSRIAYGTSANGSEHSTLRIREVGADRDLPESIPHTQFASLAWDADGRGFHYTRHPAAGEVPAGEEVFHTRVYHHRLGDDPARDSLVFGGEGRPIQELRGVYGSSDRAWLFLRTSLDWSRNDLFVKPAGSSGPFTPVATGLDGTCDGDAWHGRLVLRTNVGAPRYRIVVTDPGAPDPSRWKVLIPEQSGVIEDFQLVRSGIVITVSENAVSRLLRFGPDGTFHGAVPLPALGSVSGLGGDPESDEIVFTFASFAIPSAVYRCDLGRTTADGAAMAPRPLEPAPTELPAADFTVRQEWVTSADGTRFPVFIVHRKNLTMDGKRPTILTGYGGFNQSEVPAFSATNIPWLQAGGVLVQACLRGGGEFGRAWHEAGRLERKQNVFDDFDAAARWLVERGITRPRWLAARGGSNGGLLVGAALTQHPERFGAVVCQVPLLDMLRYHRFSIARYWVPEYGSSEDPRQLEFLLAYSPYHHVVEGTHYPPTLLTAGESDARVAPLHARKMTALLQARSAGGGPILLRVETRAGHGQGKPTSKRIEEAVDILSFLMLQFGVSAG